MRARPPRCLEISKSSAATQAMPSTRLALALVLVALAAPLDALATPLTRRTLVIRRAPPVALAPVLHRRAALSIGTLAWLGSSSAARAAEKPAGPAPASELLRAARDALVPLPERVKAGDYEGVRVVLVSEQLKPLWQGKLAKNPITLIADALDDGFEALELREDISGHLLQADTMLYDNGFKDNGGGGGSKTEVVKEPMAELAAALKGVDKVLALLQ